MKRFILILAMLMLTQCRVCCSEAEIAVRINPPTPDMSGIAVTKDDRILLAFPRHADNHDLPALAEYKNGKLIPFPDEKTTLKGENPSEYLVSPHGMTLDSKGRLWVVDNGKLAGIKEIQNGAAKVVCFDVNSRKMIYSIPILPPVLQGDAHLNDIRVDLIHGRNGTVYITNSSFGKTPSLVVVDIESGKSREVLVNHYSTEAQKGFYTYLEGAAHTFDYDKPSFPVGGANGIAYIEKENKLYWTPITGRGLYSISTDILSDFSKSEKEIEDTVKYEGDRPACDGLAEDKDGNIYFGDFEQLALVKRSPDGVYSVVAKSPEFIWPDGLAFSNGYLYVTLGQWNRLGGFNNGKDLRKPPYLVMKVKIED